MAADRKIDLVVTGTGAFASRLCLDLAVVATRPFTVGVCGREGESRARADWLCGTANARAALFNRAVTFEALTLRWDATDALAETISTTRPGLIVHSATLQSPWDVANKTGSQWADLVEAAGGFGFTAPLQAVLALRLARAAKDAGHPAKLVNACYPDLVNRILVARGLSPTCGAGNVAILAAYFADALGERRPGTVRVLAHHHHLAAFFKPAAERQGVAPRVWLDGKELSSVYRRFARVHLQRKPAMAALAGASAIPLLLALLGHQDCVGHAPGPLGRAGGYPVAVRQGVLTLDLPPDISVEEAELWLEQFGAHEPVTLSQDDRLEFSDQAREVLRPHAPDLIDGFHVDDLEVACEDLIRLRQRMEGGGRL